MDVYSVYANVETAKGFFKNSRRDKNYGEPIYDNDVFHSVESKITTPARPAKIQVNKQSSWRAAALILGLLSLLLLIGLITLVFLHIKASVHWKSELAELRTILKEDRDQVNKTQVKANIHWESELAKLKTILKEERDQFNKTQALQSEDKWLYFSGSFYYVSSNKKSWQESRDVCKGKDADLVIVNNNEEQDFVRRWKTRTWIGLTDNETEGTWKWVDGTPLGTPSYWGKSEPNDAKGNEDCVEIYSFEVQNCWNDAPCSTEKDYICEVHLK